LGYQGEMTDSRMTQRVVGAMVLVALVVIFIPMLFERDNTPPTSKLPPLPPAPEPAAPLVIPLETAKPEAPQVSPGPSPSAAAPSKPSESPVAAASPAEARPPGEAQAVPSPPVPEAAEIEPSAAVEPASPREPPSAAPPRAQPSAPSAGERVASLAPRRTNASQGAASSAAAAVPSVPESRAPAPKERSSWVVQVGTFSSAETAMELRDRLRRKGHKAFVEVLKVRGGVLYRVRVGPEEHRQAADALRGKLKTELRLDALVMRYP
jgi:DedD protein